MRLLVVTARYPTPDRPAAGAFVRDRLRDPSLNVRLAAPDRYNGSRLWRFVRLTWTALTARGRFDGVEGHFVLPTGPVALIAARLRGVPLVVVAHGSDIRAIVDGRGPRRWLGRLVLRRANRVVANSAATADGVRDLGVTAVVVHPGVDLGRFEPSARPTTGGVLYLGGDVDLKGVDVARRLADTLRGPGLDEIDPDELPAVIAAHDILLVPSRGEGFGLVAAEATAAGRWVVAAAVGGLPEVVVDGVTGTLVSDENYAGAIAGVPAYDPWAVAAHAKRFDLHDSQAAMADVWRGVVGGGQGAG